MAINFPTFVDKEIPSPEKFNAFVQALQAKFTAGIGSAEIQWPLNAGGNLNMLENEITGATKLLTVVNADAYDTVQEAVNAAKGGILFIKPDVTLTSTGLETDDDLTIIGCGPTSVLGVATGGTGPLLRTTAAGVSITISNLSLKGRGNTSDGIVLRGVDQALIHNVNFDNFDGTALHITNSGTVGNTSERVLVSNCIFTDGTGNHVLADDVEDMAVTGCYSYNCGSNAFEFAPTDSLSYVARINISNNIISDSDQSGIVVRGSGGAVNARFADAVISGNIFYGNTQTSGPAIECGAASAVYQRFNIVGNNVSSAVSDAIKVYGTFGSVTGNNCTNAGQHGIDCTTSAHMTVSGNNFYGANNIGVKADNVNNYVLIRSNLVEACNTAITYSQGAYPEGNQGAVGIDTVLYVNDNTLVVPANLLRTDDVLRILANIDITTGTADTIALEVDSQTVAVVDIDGADPGQARLEANVYITGSGAIDSIFSCVSESTGDAVSVGRYSRTGLDFTSDVTVEMTNTGASTTKQGIMLYIQRGSNQS